jgi:hypothetical protein
LTYQEFPDSCNLCQLFLRKIFPTTPPCQEGQWKNTTGSDGADGGAVSLRSTFSSNCFSVFSVACNWTITGLTPYKPAYVEFQATTNNITRLACVKPISGFTRYSLGNWESTYHGVVFCLGGGILYEDLYRQDNLTEVMIPTSSTVTLGVYNVAGALRFYQ